MSDAIFRLTDLTIDEVSFVDKGDNPDAHIMIFKRAPEAAKMEPYPMMNQAAPQSTADILAARRFREEFYELKDAYCESVYGILASSKPAEMAGMLAKSTTEFEAAIGEMLSGDTAKLIPLLETIKNPGQGETAKKKIKKAIAAVKAFAFKIQEAHVDENEVAEKANAEKLAKESAEKAETEKREREALEKRLAEIEKRAADAEAEVSKMRDEKLTVEFVEKAKVIGGYDHAVMGDMLKGAFGRSKEEGEKLETMLRALSAQAKKNGALLSVVGSDSNESADTPSAKLEVEARKLVASDKLSYPVAYAKAMKANPELAALAIKSA